ncbi:MAG: zf-HC2 domain-containing protein [Burkholderiales bacterium]|nr:zf-HC2 domain-containing protein [Burkholderiales bacterium]
MDPPEFVPSCTQEAAYLLPWYVNGTLAPADERRVAEHLQQCETCRGDAAGLARLRSLMRAPAQVEHAPHAGLHKLLARIDAAEQLDAASPMPVPVPAARGGRAAVRWLAAAVVVQAVALAAVGGTLLLKRPASEAAAPAYRTLTRSTAEPPALRVVFAPSITLDELQQLLRAHRLAVTAGPSEAGIFTLTLRQPADTPAGRQQALLGLRADPRVRFAEPVGGEAETRP